VSIFGSIMSKIFSHPASAAGAQAPAQPPAEAAAVPQQPNPATAAAQPAPQSAPAPAASSSAGDTPPQASAPPPVVDFEAVLVALASQTPQKLDWRRSIVDLLKLLDLDSSFDARKELAQELHYTGDTGDSASMNIWLHQQVMHKLAENGGKVPDDLKH